MKRVLNMIFIAIFIAICAAPMAGMVFGYENKSAEKRALKNMPDISTEDGINTMFTQEFDDYFTDNFAFRPELITADAYINAQLFGESVSEKVIIGKDGWLFFEPALSDYKGANLLSDNEIYRISKTLRIQQEYLKEQGIDFVFTIAPNKSSIYGKYMPDRFLIVSEQNNANNLYAKLEKQGLNYVDLHEVLRGQEEQIYHKLDTHWNNKGALLAYNALLDKVRELNNRFSFDAYKELIPKPETIWRADLSGMLYPAASIKDEQLVYDIEKEYTSARPIKSLEELTIKTASESGKLNLFMLRDSFANALIPIMSNEFASAVYSRATPYDYSIINEDDIEVVILEIVERNLSDLIKQAPLMPAQVVQIKEDLVPSDMDISLLTEEIGDFIKIMGFAVPEGYDEEKDYDIFVRINSSKGSTVFVPFPISEDGYFDGKQDKGNVSFSMIIEKSMACDFTVDIILFDGLKYRVCVGPNG